MNRVTHLLSAAMFLIAPAFASTLVVNDTATLIRFPFGTDTASPTNYQSGATYQQIYSSQDFSGLPILITQIAFATSPSISNATAASLGLDVHLGVAATTAAAPSDTFSNNRGSNYQDVFAGTLTFTPAMNNSFDMVLNLSTPFLYNPGSGDLLLDVALTQAPNISGSALYFGGDSSATDDRIYSATPAASGRIDFNTLATQFTFTPAVATPEPSSLYMAGICCAVAVMARKRIRIPEVMKGRGE